MSVKKRIFPCPKCNSDQLTHEKIYEIWSDLNTGEVLQDNSLTEQYVISCRNCNFRTEDIGELDQEVVVINDSGEIVWRQREKDIPISSEYSKIVDFEIQIRDTISTKLEETYGSDWWIKGIPENIRVNAEKRKQNEEKDWHSSELVPLINHINFSDYSKIICYENNWNKIFKKIFRDIEKTKYYLSEITSLRNIVMHIKRPLMEEEKKHLNILIESITRLLPHLN